MQIGNINHNSCGQRAPRRIEPDGRGQTGSENSYGREMLNDVLELVAATARWSRQSEMSNYFLQGTLWYGMMCRTFLLLERILRSVAAELSLLAPTDAEKIAIERAEGRSLSRMTFGQCLAVVEMLVPLVSKQVFSIHPELDTGQRFLSDADLKLWKRAVALRNRMAHHGPGFLDTVDLNAGRIWRSSITREPLEEQAEEIWRMSRTLCASPLIINCLAVKGSPPAVTRAELIKAQEAVLELRLSVRHEVRASGHAASIAVETFHAAREG
jgi:hypothetical protein